LRLHGRFAKAKGMRPLLFVALLWSVLVHAEPPNERLEIALKAYRLAATGYREGNVPLETAAMWSVRAWELQKASGAPNAGSDYVFRMKDLENVATARAKDGRANALEQLNAQFLRVEAEAAVKKK
jgi:hypothetical protein